MSGFLEMRHAGRLQDDSLQGDAPLSELRFHLDAKAGSDVIWTLAIDGILDDVGNAEIDLRTGEGRSTCERRMFSFACPTASMSAPGGRS